MVSYTQDWARILYVGDIQFVITKRECDFEDEIVPEEFKKYGKTLYYVDIEFHLNQHEYPCIYWCESLEERDIVFDRIAEEELQAILFTELGCDLP